jgi:hypothetical protein
MEYRAVLQSVGCEAVDQLQRVICLRRACQVLSHVAERRARLGLRHYVQIAPAGKLHEGQAEQLQMACQAARRPPHALRHRAQLALVGRVQRDDSVGLAQVVPL